LATQGNITQGSFAGREQHHRPLQPLLADITMWRNTHSCPEHPGEVGWTEAGDTSQLRNRDIVINVLRDVIQNAT
jgi:hypothetical protein